MIGSDDAGAPRSVDKREPDQSVADEDGNWPEPVAAPMGRRERNKLEKRRRIVAAARALFDSKGFAHTTTQEIAEAADVGTGTLFLYVKSKEDLLVMVFKDEMIETSRAAFDGADPDAPLIDQLMAVFEAMVAYHARDLDLSRTLLKEIMFPAAPERVQDIQELMRTIYQRMAQAVTARRRAEGLRDDVPAARAAETMFSAYYMVLMTWLRGDIGREQFSARLRPRLGLVIDGLRAAPPTRPKPA